MKGWLIVAIIAVALWYSYHSKLNKKSKGKKPVGVARSTGSGVRQATQFSTTGSTSPGSGVQPVQPSMASTWGIGGGRNIGYTGPSYKTAKGLQA
jgi:hypothetical protein